jgi:hypothetical protein
VAMGRVVGGFGAKEPWAVRQYSRLAAYGQ